MNKKNIINEFVLEFNGKRYVPRPEHDFSDGKSRCTGCAFFAHCSKHGENSVIPKFAESAVCSSIGCIWKREAK